MSGLQDARVLQAFGQGVQRPYMLGVEQRLSNVAQDLDSLEGLVDYYRQAGKRTIQVGTGGLTTTSTTYIDTGLSVTIDVDQGRSVIILSCWDDFWISTTGTATGSLGISVNGGTESLIFRTDKLAANANTYAVSLSAAYINLEAGRYNYNLRVKTSAGTLYLGGSASNKLLMAAIQL